MEPGLDADLCRQLARATTSPFFRSANRVLLSMADEGQTARDYLIAAGMKAYTFSNLSAPLQQFLQLCDRSVEIREQMFGGNPTGMTVEEEDARVMEQIDREAEDDD